MWTPKRILLLALGIVLFFGGYLVYGSRLGGVDGLPPLPEEYWPNPTAPPIPPRPRDLTRAARQLEKAFGKDCPEIRWSIKIEVQPRGLVLASTDFRIEDDGRVRLRPLSLALFGKTRGEDGVTPEINTVRCDVAYLTFERPIQTIADMGKYRITAGQIVGSIVNNIRIVNNRRTPHRDDDVIVEIRKGPLYYEQKKQQIWTDEVVRLVDGQGKARPNVISGQGLILDLIAAEEKPRAGRHGPARRRQQMDSITGVKRVRLKSAVDMRLYVDARSGFLNSRRPDAKPQQALPPAARDREAEKAHLVIKTHGPFDYDLVKDFARFDIPPTRPGQVSLYPEYVQATRVHETLGKLDHLLCEHLELQFRKKEATSPAAGPARRQAATGGDRAMNLQVETALATGREVVLTSDAENLEAHGHDFFYDARTTRTTLKGRPMWALKEGNRIVAEQLVIQQGDKEGRGQSAVASGPGRLSLYDKAKKKFSLHARWKERLVSTREGDFDLLHLVGEASFRDEENAQELRADDLKVWLHPGPPAAGKVEAPTKSDGQPATDNGQKQPSRRPHHLIASDRVVLLSPEVNIRNARRLVVWFKDAPSPGARGPSQTAASGGGQPPEASSSQGAHAPRSPQQQPAAAGQRTTDNGQKRPIDLSARSVEAHVLRLGERSQLQELKSEGAVHVIQAPARQGEKGVDIKGDALRLVARPDGGNLLVVTGDLARLEMERLLILGPEVNIDQSSNEAWVKGIGAMTMESDTDFQGKKLKKAVPMTIHWNESMYFYGKLAEFRGGIQADQENARLTCQTLQVFFDRPISLRGGERNGQRSRVSNLICDKSVRVEDSVFEKGRLEEYRQLTGSAVAYDNEESTIQATGPGEVRILQRGDPAAGGAIRPPAGPVRPRAVPDDKELKLTYINYFKRMYGNKKTNLAIFYMNVRVLHVPCKNEEEARGEIDLERIFERSLPPGAMYLRCDRLEVHSRPPRNGKSYQEMDARGRVTVQAQDFSGQAERVIYDEEKDQVIFDGGEGGVATLYKFRLGEAPQKIEGQKIIYSRRTGQHRGEKMRGIEGRQ